MYRVSRKGAAVPAPDWLVSAAAPMADSVALWRATFTPTIPASASRTTVATTDSSTAGRILRRLGLAGAACAGTDTCLVGPSAAAPATVSATPTPGWPVRTVAKSEQLGKRFAGSFAKTLEMTALRSTRSGRRSPINGGGAERCWEITTAALELS